MKPLRQLFLRIRLILIFFSLILPAGGWSQTPESIPVEPFPLVENLLDQEGLFYQPQLQKIQLENNSKGAAEKQLQAVSHSASRNGIAAAAIRLAWLEFQDGNSDKVQPLLKVALDAELETGHADHVAQVQLLSAYFRIKAGDLAGARKLLEPLLPASGISRMAHASVLAMLGQIYLLQSDFSAASKSFLQSSYEFGMAYNKPAEARMLVQSAEASIRKNDNHNAENLLRKALQIFTNLKDLAGQGITRRNFGLLYFKSGSYEKAIEEFRLSLNVSPQVSTTRLLRDAYLKVSTIKTLAGDHKQSDDLRIMYEQLRDSADNMERSRALNSELTKRELMERNSITSMLRKEIDFSSEGISANELERNRLLIDAEIERLEKEKLIEEMDQARIKSDLSGQERDEKIKELTREKEQQELALSKKELEVSRFEAFRNLMIATVVSIVVISLLLYNRYRREKKTRKDLDQTYRELSETHSKLLSAQEQLVHSQKMASLGQLTAGIAHEIQNPLNFVNNFSELTLELIEEMKDPGANKEEILSDIVSNVKKINEHGRRADRIVKGMLVHSRAGQPEKHPADLNKMIDELIELSYHGNRTRNNGFTADIIKHLDPTLPKVNMVMQDISRVLINLFNNSFYAVAQRVLKEPKGFVATVGVSTRLENGNVIIKIRDNGTGIPNEVKQKIFDPFFTTKPTGEGTGLGLSLSYDIIAKGHSGTMEVNSEPGSYTEFILTIPVE